MRSKRRLSTTLAAPRAKIRTFGRQRERRPKVQAVQRNGVDAKIDPGGYQPVSTWLAASGPRPLRGQSCAWPIWRAFSRSRRCTVAAGRSARNSTLCDRSGITQALAQQPPLAIFTDSGILDSDGPQQVEATASLLPQLGACCSVGLAASLPNSGIVPREWNVSQAMP